jgi:S-adenosylmethionine:tRNA ribosyltransferase-isomerase
LQTARWRLLFLLPTVTSVVTLPAIFVLSFVESVILSAINLVDSYNMCTFAVTMTTKEIQISDYSYELPDERIAKFPIAQRDHSKLLVYRHGDISEDVFYRLTDYLPKGALMVMNNTKVIQARLHFRKRLPTEGGGWKDGALIEIFLLEPFAPADYEQMFQTTGQCSWLCLVGNQKKWKDGPLTISHGPLTLTATRHGEHGTSQLIDFQWSVDESHSPMSFAEVIDLLGELPIPPYLNRKTEESDKTTSQTVYSKIKGSVAAPTAGLHFTERVLSDVDAHGIEREEVTLHVGAGTFKPVKSATIGDHAMHTEYIAVHRRTIERLLAHGGEAIAVGTTSVRTLESLYYMGLKVLKNPDIAEEQLHVSQWEPYDGGVNEKLEMRNEKLADAPKALEALLGWMDRNHLSVLHSSTQIIIAPGYDYKIVKMLITNFHQPQSTLLLLVSAFVRGDWHRIYDYALAHDFRFLSYGDSSLLIP